MERGQGRPGGLGRTFGRDQIPAKRAGREDADAPLVDRHPRGRRQVSDGQTRRPPLVVLADGVEQAGYMLVLLGQSAVRLITPTRQPVRAWKRFIRQLYVQLA